MLQYDEKLMPKCSVFRQDDNTLVSAPLEDMSPLLPLDELLEVMEGKSNQYHRSSELKYKTLIKVRPFSNIMYISYLNLSFSDFDNPHVCLS